MTGLSARAPAPREAPRDPGHGCYLAKKGTEATDPQARTGLSGTRRTRCPAPATGGRPGSRTNPRRRPGAGCGWVCVRAGHSTLTLTGTGLAGPRAEPPPLTFDPPAVPQEGGRARSRESTKTRDGPPSPPKSRERLSRSFRARCLARGGGRGYAGPCLGLCLARAPAPGAGRPRAVRGACEQRDAAGAISGSSRRC